MVKSSPSKYRPGAACPDTDSDELAFTFKLHIWAFSLAFDASQAKPGVGVQRPRGASSAVPIIETTKRQGTAAQASATTANRHSALLANSPSNDITHQFFARDLPCTFCRCVPAAPQTYQKVFFFSSCESHQLENRSYRLRRKLLNPSVLSIRRRTGWAQEALWKCVLFSNCWNENVHAMFSCMFLSRLTNFERFRP